jgi:hypothetical protein
MQMIKMHDMVVYILRTDHEVADQLCVFRNLVVERILNGAYRGDAVHQRAYAADALRERPGITRIAAAQDDLDAAHHRAGRIRLRDLVPVHLCLDAQVAFDSRDGIYYDSVVHCLSASNSLLVNRSVVTRRAAQPPVPQGRRSAC